MSFLSESNRIAEELRAKKQRASGERNGPAFAAPFQLIRRAEVERATGLSRSSIYLQMNQGTFPLPIRLGLRSVAWRADEVAEWMKNAPRASYGNADSDAH